MDYPVLKLKRGKDESLRRFHPWVFSGALTHMPADLEEGSVVRVLDHDGNPMGVGHFQIGSIAVRMLDFNDSKIDADFYAARLQQAWRMREALGLRRDDNNAFRLVHGEGDFLPGLVVDIYDTTAVVQAHSPGMHFARHIIADALMQLPGADIKAVYYKSETTLPYKARLDPQHD